MTQAPAGPLPPSASSEGLIAAPVLAEQNPFPWLVLLGVGLTSIGFGIFVLAWPHTTLRVMAVLVGLWFLVMGLARISGAFLSNRGIGHQLLSGILGILLIFTGVIFLRDLVNGILLIATLVALNWLFSGFVEIALGVAATGQDRRLLLLMGTVSVALGIVLLTWPRLSLAALILNVGISSLIIGVAQVGFALRARTEDGGRRAGDRSLRA